MEHSLYAYFTRRTEAELLQVIAMCKSQLPSEYYSGILKTALEILQQKRACKARPCEKDSHGRKCSASHRCKK